jgi:hypothetical protein
METLEDKKIQLDAFGIILTFPTFTIKAINGEDFSNINFEVDSISHRAIIFYWQITQEDCNNFDITKDDTFTTLVVNKIFSWKITQRPIHDVYGWVKITANLINLV